MVDQKVATRMRAKVWLMLTAMLLLGGCASVAPKYVPSVENVQALKNAGIPKARVADFAATPELNRITLRGSPLDG